MKPRRLARLAVQLALLITTAITLGTAPSAANPPSSLDTPQTIPALRDWDGGHGWYRFGPQTRIVAGDGLRAVADVLADDLNALTGRHVHVTTGHARPGDVVLATGTTPDGYRLDIAGTLTVTAASPGAVFAGTRSVLQMLRQSRAVPRGTARDWADTTERTVMLDVARKFYPKEWIHDLIRDLSYLKYTHLQLHLSDDQAFRLESAGHPQIVSAQHYSKQDIRDLIAFAARYHITIIPEIDMPGHMTQILSGYPQLRLTGADGTVKAGSLDLTQDAAWDLAQSILAEYLPLFPGQVFHLGADEWLPERQLPNFPQLDAAARARFGPDARGRDLYYAFINQANDFVRAHGKTLRIWNDQLVPGYLIQVNPNVQITHWYGAGEPTPQQLIDAGHQVVNANWEWLCYIVGISHPNSADIYEWFRPSIFAGGHSAPTSAVQLSVWADIPPDLESESQVAWGLFRPLRAFAQAAWKTPAAGSSFDMFAPLIERIGHAPGYTTSLTPIGAIPSSSIAAAAGHSLDNLTDSRPGTYFEGQRPTRPGDTVSLNLGTVSPLGTIDLNINTTLHAALEVSADGSTWHHAGTVTGPASLHTQLPPGTSGRHVRLRAIEPAPTLKLSEFGVTTVAAIAGPLSTSLPAYDSYTLDRITDTDPQTYFWSGRGPRGGDYVLHDLGTVKPVSSISLLMSDPGAHASDYLHHGVLETSTNGTSWTQLGTYDNQPEIHATTTGTARYIRFRVTAQQPEWAIIRAFTVS